MRTNSYPVVAAGAVAVAVALLQIAVYQWCEIGSLKRELRLMSTAKEIADDQISELSTAFERVCSERDSVAVKNFVHGVVEAINRPDHFKSVWHDGYNQGVRTFKYATGEEGEDLNR
jgi:hypothetical protein